MNGRIKAIERNGQWELEVLGVPYGGPFNGKDHDGEYFSAETKLHEDKFPSVPVVYYHGLTPDKRMDDHPEYIGRTTGYRDTPEGRWYTVVLDQAKALAARVWDAAKQGLLRASSGAIAHLVRRAPDGKLLEWPLVELSLIDLGDGRAPANPYAVAIPRMKAVYEQAGIDLPDIQDDSEAEEPEADAEGLTGQSADVAAKGDTVTNDETETHEEQKEMDEKEIQNMIADALKADREAREAAEKEANDKAEKDAVKAENEALKAQLAESNRLPFDGTNAPVKGEFGDLRKFDGLDAADQAFMIGMVKSAGHPVSEAAIKALVIKLGEDNGPVGIAGKYAMKLAGFDAAKANEVNYSTLSTYGDQFAGVAYSQAIWEAIRKDSFVANNLPAIEVPQGAESIIIPIEGADPAFYKVAQATGDAGTGGLSTPAPTVKSSQLGTANATLTPGKMGARVRWTGELDEDSIVPWVAQLRAQLARAGAEQLESAIIDGDTATASNTNINDVAGTPAATDLFMLMDGFRKLALVTNTANSTSIGTLDANSFLTVLKLMGSAGKNADPAKTAFILDPNVYWLAQQLEEVKTRDVFAAPTIENGLLTKIWGYPVYVSYSMHRPSLVNTSYEYKTEATGKIDVDTASDNTKGAFLAVRWDQWMLGYKRRMTMEVVRHPEWDGSEITCLMRVGLKYRDTDASAIGYNVTL